MYIDRVNDIYIKLGYRRHYRKAYILIMFNVQV